MGCETWIVEAQDRNRKTLWRQVFTKQAMAEKCFAGAKKQGLDVHIWSM